MPWLRRRAALVETVVNDPGATKSGVCAECLAKNGRPVSEVGRPPFHPHCACRVDLVERETQPGRVLDENFEGMTPAEFPAEPVDEGGVTDMEITL